jgi:cytochrome c oxidase subunit 4
MNHADDHATHSAMPGLRTYLIIYAALMILLVATVAAAFLPWTRLLPAHLHHWAVNLAVGLALLIALAKCLLILLYFMHVKFSAKMVYAFAGAGFLWLGIMFTLVLSDYVTRNHPAGANDKGEPRYLQTTARADDKPTNRPFEHSPR